MSLRVVPGPVSHQEAVGSAAHHTLFRRVQVYFARTDDGAGGKFQTLRRGVKFWCRCWWKRESLRASESVFRSGVLMKVAEDHPAVVLRPLRSYLRSGLNSEHRAQAVRSQFDWLTATLPEAAIQRLYSGRPVSLLGVSSPVEGLGLSLSAAAHLGREGELALHLEWREVRVMSLAFSVLDADLVVPRDTVAITGSRAVVGCLQGVRGAELSLRALTAACQRLRPSALLVTALQGLSAAWALQEALAVAAGSHVYARYGSRRRELRIDYDAAWRDSGAERVGRHYWMLPSHPTSRPESEVESKRRAQHRRRHALRQALFMSVMSGAWELECDGTGASVRA